MSEIASLVGPGPVLRFTFEGPPHSGTGWTASLVGPGGLEPPTSPLSGVRSSQLSYGPGFLLQTVWVAGGAGRDRTGDLLNANQALSQLSYSPLGKKLIEADWMQELSARPTTHANSLADIF